MAYAHRRDFDRDDFSGEYSASGEGGEQYRIAPHQDDWNALRDELETLLEQVNGRHLRQTSSTPAQPQSQAFSLRTPDPADAPRAGSRPGVDRRQVALNSVQVAVDRFNETGEVPPMPAHSANQLQSAIEQIRASQNRPPVSRRRGSPRAPESSDRGRSGRLDELGTTLAEINTRFERVERVMGSQQNSTRAVEDMAVQIEQLSSVVELLANSVGERGQIKRIETQIAKLAEAVTSGSDLDFGTINERLDVLGGAFEQLTLLQSQSVAQQDAGAGGAKIDAIEIGIRNLYERFDTIDLASIEAGIRSVYSRMDAIEEGLNETNPALERLSAEMAEFTRAMQAEPGSELSSSLAARLDTLNQRLAQVDVQSEHVGGLHADMEALQEAVLSAVGPKFDELESQIGSLSRRFEQTPQSAPHAGGESLEVERLEQQIRALAEKMDRTGEELGKLHQPDQSIASSEGSPDFTAIADMVAMRTGEAMREALEEGNSSYDQKAFEKLEATLSNLVKQNEVAEPELEFSNLQNSMDLVNERLERLELTLNRPEPGYQATDNSSTPPASVAANPMLANNKMVAEKPEPDVMDGSNSVFLDDEAPEEGLRQPARPRHPGLSESSDNASIGVEPDTGSTNGLRRADNHLLSALNDTMPRAPDAEAPLSAPAYPPPEPGNHSVPVPDSLRIDESETMILDNGESDLRALAEEQERARERESSGTDRIKLPQFNTKNADQPPAPRSSFASGDRAGSDLHEESGPRAAFSTHGDSSAQTGLDKDADENRQKVSRSTFIEAARRAAKSNNPESSDAGSQSLIGRALARFQKKLKQEKEPQAEDRSTPVEERRHLPGDSRETLVADSSGTQIQEQMDVVEVEDSFLVRHRQPILLVATMLAVSMLALNLINQRFNPAETGSDAAIAGIAGEMPANVTAGGPTKQENAENSQNTGEVAPGSTDIVGSIIIEGASQGAQVRMIDPALNSDMPPTLDLASLTANQAGVGAQLVPGSRLAGSLPEALGPLELRRSALGGDARAQFEVAAIFAEGRAVAQDLGAAAIWYERAAAQGYAPATYRLGNMYENGIGVAKDLGLARVWYQKAAEAGNRMSMHNLASLLAGGGLGEQKFDEAAIWFERAAALGLGDSQFNLGMLHARGLGVPQNLEESFRWFSIAAEQGDEDAARARDDVLRSLDAQTVARLHDEIKNWTQSPMDMGANFAPIGTWSPNFDPGPQIDNKEIVLRVQAALNKLGFDAGTPDGLAGPKTVEAINAFEQATGMSISGEINPRLLSVLGSQPV